MAKISSIRATMQSNNTTRLDHYILREEKYQMYRKNIPRRLID